MRRKLIARPFFRLALERLESRRVLASGPLITEFMAINRATLQDEDGEFSDWIEIHNPTAESVDLGGWYLTDAADEPTRWQLPAVSMAPGEYRVIFASGKARSNPQSQLHTNFKLSGGGEFLALVAADGTTIEHQYAPKTPAQMDDISYGLATDLATELFFATPTPGAANMEGALSAVAEPVFSVERGFYDRPFDVQLFTNTPDAEIRYTLDGSRPTAATGIVYENPIHVSGTTTLRAGALKPGHLDSAVQTHSYLFLEDVLAQTKPDGYPDLKAGGYHVIPAAVEFHRDTILDDLKAVPTLSLVLGVEEMFGPGGTYNTGEDNPTSVEMIFADGREGFQIDAGVRQQGGASRLPTVPKHAFRLKFTSQFGPPKLDFPLFEDSPVTRFDSVILRANLQDGWQGGAAGNDQLIKDEFARRTQLDMGNLSAHGSFVHVYINGLYWGLYNMVERPDASFTSEHLGGDKDDWDALNAGRVRDGNDTAWNEMLALTPRGGPDVRNFDEATVNANYDAIQKILDVPAFIDYVLIGTYLATQDWLPNNYYAGRRSRDGDDAVDPDDTSAQFQFFHWDQEESFLGLDTFKNLPGFRSPVGRIYQLLRLSPEFRELQAQRIYEQMFNGGPLSPEAAAARYQSLVDEISDAIKGEAIRWGQAPSNVPDWQAVADSLVNEFIPNRREGIIDQYRRFRLYPETDAPVFSQQGDAIPSGQPLSMSATDATIYYTLDGSDPKLADDTVAASAMVYTEPITLSKDTLVQARALAGGQWSVRNEAQFYVDGPPAAGAVAITEINYHPVEPTAAELAVNSDFEANDFEFVELYNTSDETISLGGARFSEGIHFTFPFGDSTGHPVDLAPGQYAVIVANEKAFAARYPDGASGVLGQYSGRLANGGERMRLEGPLGATWLDFTFNDAQEWPQSADGVGGTLQLREADETDPRQYDNPFAWRGSVSYGGSPGAVALEPIGVVINEIFTRPGPTARDAIELYNASHESVDIGGWFLSDSSDNLFKYQVPAGTAIGAGEYLVFDERAFNANSTNPGPNDFALSGIRSDDVWLVVPDDSGGIARFVDDVHFGAARFGESFGRTPDGIGSLAPMARVTLGSANTKPRVGPVLISEVQYNPGEPSPAALQIVAQLHPGDLEFVELHNPTDEVVNLTQWRVRGGIEFDFAPGTVLGARETLIILSFDSTDLRNEARLAAFRAHYGVAENMAVVGGYSGRLSDGGEKIQLQRPDQLSTDDPSLIARLLEDEVIYDDVAPWPAAADGTGPSLTRTALDAWGNAPTSWTTENANPGFTEFTPVQTGDTNGDGVFDRRDISAVLQAGKYMTDRQASFAEGDWNGDGVFDKLDIVLALQTGSYRDEG